MVAAAKRGLLLSLLVFLVGCDHATKAAAQGTLASGRIITLIKGLLDLRYTQNFDTAFSLTRAWSSEHKSLWLTATALVTTVTVVGWAYLRREHASLRERVGVTLILAGALGNATDRLVRGYVVDFIHLTHWPVFNVADVLVVVGVALMAASRQNQDPATLPP
jgi:signal peptidase II